MNAIAVCFGTGEIAFQIVFALGFLEIHLRPLRLISASLRDVVKIAVQSVTETMWLEVLKNQDSVQTSWYSIEGELRRASKRVPKSARISHYYEYLARKNILPNVLWVPYSSFVKAVQKVFDEPAVGDKVCRQMRSDESDFNNWGLDGHGLWTDLICSHLQHNNWEDFACATTLYPDTMQEIQCMAIIAELVQTSIADSDAIGKVGYYYNSFSLI